MDCDLPCRRCSSRPSGAAIVRAGMSNGCPHARDVARVDISSCTSSRRTSHPGKAPASRGRSTNKVSVGSLGLTMLVLAVGPALPPVDVPAIKVPPVQVPKVQLPPVQLPPVHVPDLPKVQLPPVAKPPVEPPVATPTAPVATPRRRPRPRSPPRRRPSRPRPRRRRRCRPVYKPLRRAVERTRERNRRAAAQLRAASSPRATPWPP